MRRTQKHDVQWHATIDECENALRMPKVVDMREKISHQLDREAMEYGGHPEKRPASSLFECYEQTRQV